ncbi:hypothetical protein BgiMline_002113 [Biomphalaria glabrata]
MFHEKSENKKTPPFYVDTIYPGQNMLMQSQEKFMPVIHSAGKQEIGCTRRDRAGVRFVDALRTKDIKV